MNADQAQKKVWRVHGSSMCTTKLDLFFHDIPLGSASGFFYRYGQHVVLVTNWHVLSGINPLTGIVRHSSKCRPNRVELHVNIRNQSDGHTFIRPENWSIHSEGQSRWWKRRDYSGSPGAPIIDIGVMYLEEHLPDYKEVTEKITALPATAIVNFEDEQPQSLDYGYPEISSEVFILGYPRGLTKQGIIPIWKRATIASEPLIALEGGVPAMLVDSVTREGMSGSPVLYFGPFVTDSNGERIKTANDPSSRPAGQPWLVGVYAGRDGATGEELDMALGRVWHRRLLDEIIHDRVLGDSL